MDESSNKGKEYSECLDERKTLIKILIKFHFQKNGISFTLTNILSFDEKLMKQIKIMQKLRHLKSGAFPNQFH